MGLLSKSKQKALSTNLTYTLIGNNWLTPDDNAQTYIDGYKSLPNLYGIISFITQKSSIVPMQVMKVKNRSAAQKYKSMVKAMNSSTDFHKLLRVKEEAFVEQENHPLQDLINKPNEIQAMEELNEAFDGYLLLTGNAYLHGLSPGVGKNAKKPNELYVIPSPTVEPRTNNLEVTSYKISYFRDELDPEVVGHAKYFNPINGTELPANMLKGMSPLMACRNLLKRYASADIAQGSMFTNMGPAGILTGDKDSELTEEQAVAVKDRYKQFHTGAMKAGDIIVTPAKLNWQQIGLSPVDLNTLEGKKEILNELCNVYKVPIGIFTENNSTDNNLDNSRKMFITDAVVPVVEKRKQTLNRWLAPKFGDDIFLEPDYSIFPEMQEDMKAKVEWLSKVWELTPNQRLQELGYDENPDPNMNKVYITSGLMPLADASFDVEDVEETEEVMKDNE